MVPLSLWGFLETHGMLSRLSSVYYAPVISLSMTKRILFRHAAEKVSKAALFPLKNHDAPQSVNGSATKVSILVQNFNYLWDK